jgi:phosphatidate cytidylyltransferase
VAFAFVTPFAKPQGVPPFPWSTSFPFESYSMLGWRIGISVVLIPILVGLFMLDHRAGESAPYLLALCLVLAVRGIWEFVWLVRVRLFEPSFPLLALGASLIVASGWLGHAAFLPMSAKSNPSLSLAAVAVCFSLVVLALFLRAALRYREPGRSMETLGVEVLGISYLGMLLAVTTQLRWVAGSEAGYFVLGSLVIAAKCGDIGAYTLGRLFGKRKLIPRLSPGKTWMGFWGALLGAALGAWAWLTFAPPLFGQAVKPAPTGWAILYGVVVGLVGLIGDLCESLIKRDVGQKDSAPLFPGFGGLLDLLDSVLYAGPVAYLLWLVLPLAG